MPIAAFFFAVAVCALLGFAVEKIAYKPLRGASPLAVLLTAIGVSYFLQGVAQVAFGAGTKNVNVAIAINGKASFALGGLTITYSTIFTLIVGVALMVGLTLFIKKTRTGQAMLALSEDRGAAQLMGINANLLISLTFIIGICFLNSNMATALTNRKNIRPPSSAGSGSRFITARFTAISAAI